MQRRRKPKNEPRNIFDKGSSPRPSKPSPSHRRTPSQSSASPKRVVQPTSPPPKPTVTPIKPEPPTPAVETPQSTIPDEESTDKTESIIDELEIEQTVIIEEQVLGIPRRKSRGLQPVEEATGESSTDSINKASSKAIEIIEASKARANANWQEQKTEPTPSSTTTPPPPVKPRTNRRRTNTSFQPASREKRLDRSRHMEYKYEVRGLLKEIDVAEEHRSAMLGTIWAKGERQTSADAIQFILEKQAEGILDQEQTDRLMSVVDDYTIRR